MEKLIYEIDNKKYVLFETEFPLAIAKTQEKTISLYGGIIQSAKVINSFWNGASVNIKSLIPEERALDFARHTS
jgi:hypothetical protein